MFCHLCASRVEEFSAVPISSFLHSLQCSNTELSNVREKRSRSNLSAGTLFIPYFLIYQTNKRCKSGFGILDLCKQKSSHFNNQSARICLVFFPKNNQLLTIKYPTQRSGQLLQQGAAQRENVKWAQNSNSGSFGGRSRRRMQTLNW